MADARHSDRCRTAQLRMKIEVRDLIRKFGAYTALNRVSLDADDGELVALLGPSGSGKTTLLRIIAGLDFPDDGNVYFDGIDSTRLKIQIGLEVMRGQGRLDKAKVRDRVTELLQLVQLPGFENRLPHQLSGGQRQRVALARALAINPRILLLDEPFGALDAKVRKELRNWIKELQHQLKITTFFVTHDQEEALEMADRVAVMNNARIEQIGTPSEIQDQPATAFVEEFIHTKQTF